jgi:hypothetical protein
MVARREMLKSRSIVRFGVATVNIHFGLAEQARVIDFNGRQVLPLSKRLNTDSP